MSCATLETILKSCDNNSGGIYRFFIGQQDNVDSISTDETGTNWQVDGITLVSDSTEEIDGDNWTVDCFEVDKILIKDAENLFSFLETLKICTQVNL